MEARIEIAAEKKLIGKYIAMSFLDNKTFQLWSSFMPHHKEIKNKIGTDLYSLEVFPVGYFNEFDPKNDFEKWAAVEVSNFSEIPSGMEDLVIPSGLYAVFIHEGENTKAHKTYHSIFVEWLPNSTYTVDDRPHFAIMGEKYKKDDPNSEEEIWIPIKNKI
ncbi:MULTISPECIES: GyrI-like domain-containing protein [Flavobacterium]|jgi:AraC family transcriptional regulator|uniref:GyrI-like domain-containing protein n=1 Tax=Flavobacterium cupriresistens TaxID=2893885 RepID=A0ABU4R7N5_9FLAO|nr:MULTISPECIES: GyrI-like domain-containing protein [unclassified Flavobacterium]KLT70114.1 AraC family transcriptional regulator [Flavobacterium sp. ABG]MDX6188558.1 GyrI-like domain-containing protein [Flavobacterium sp. Fl-318]UFH44774.1 GyrI-like domain-containing protein [Flavobacterium sp. F-323]